ncbi:ethanolamine ammonia-lyase subunit EutC [Fulvimarina endophytica]|uniref:Ethanolamine ammonia-lyase small subunit n=1 Tax=Fulvimarina endophytica TaxID=2293836 RepID=A0A371X362_9HYPH|nr:ethanolamine ammonia-lyase subunit EutC [Fulvimarina endophytica]RFC63677.1 ethanolamine ammonia-lyase subunit EutC [Fulvimarina endophytica]
MDQEGKNGAGKNGAGEDGTITVRAASGEAARTGSVVENPWRRLRRFTDARIGLGRAGTSLPTREHLEFQLAHARARDAVHLPLDIDRLTAAMAKAPRIGELGDPVRLRSAVADRSEYLRRPDLGERLDEASKTALGTISAEGGIAIVIADGLSSFAIQENAVPFLSAFLDLWDREGLDLAIAPPVVVEQARVAIGDAVGEALKAKASIVLIGERPGLSSPDSLGIYFTWAPASGLTDSRRNCISNIRPAGLSFEEAARRTLYLLKEAAKIETSGVKLKDRSVAPEIGSDEREQSFLTGGRSDE